jgi:hypothetical protein
MKKSIPNVFTKSDKIICRLSGLILSLILSLNLSAQKISTIEIDTISAGNWVKYSLLTYTYDGSGFLINQLTQTWNGAAWADITQSIYLNNTDGTADSMKFQTWSGSAWNNVSRTKYTYNGSKKVLTSLTQSFVTSVWMNSSRLTNSYDGSGFLTNSLTEIFLGTWQNSSRIKYTNNVDGTINRDTTQVWNLIGSVWDNSTRSTFLYNGSKKVQREISDNFVASSWQPNTKDTSEYDVNGFLIKTVSTIWNGSTAWINNNQVNFTNNTDGTPSVAISQKWDGVSTWINKQKLIFTYKPATPVPELKSEETFTIYPNPAGNQIAIKGNLSIQGSAYSITDQTGKLVLKGKLINQNGTIDISALANGIYFLRIGEKSQNSYKFIKNK